MRIVAISGSLQRASSNHALLERAARLAPDDVTITLYEGVRALPHFDLDLNEGAPPESVARHRAALAGADAAYYLVHSMYAGVDFAERDREAAGNFVAAAQHVAHTIYLGGLLPQGEGVSRHLTSRAETGEIAATSEKVTVYFDLEARKKAPLPDELRPRLEAALVERAG